MVKPFPKLKFSLKNIGASIVSLGLGLGSGEYILWPFLVVLHGFDILWGALLGITIQLFLIIELQRYTSVRGEDFVSGIYRLNKKLPILLIFFAVIGFGWPGFATSSTKLLSDVVTISPNLYSILPYFILVCCAALLVFGKDVYKKVEFVQTSIVFVSFIFIIYLFIRLFDLQIVSEMLQGVLGLGNNSFGILSSEDLTIFIGAVAYAGTGGVLILSQSFYTIDEKHGMTRYVPKIKDEEHLAHYNVAPDESEGSIKNFKSLRRFQIFENTTFFWLLGILTICMLGYISHVLLKDTVDIPKDLSFLKFQAEVLGMQFGSFFSIFFILIGFFALISVQLGIYDITARIFVYTLIKYHSHLKTAFLYNIGVSIQLFIGIFILLIGFKEPLWLITTGAVINAFTMAFIAISIVAMNRRLLKGEYRSNMFVNTVLICSSIFYITLIIINIL